MRILTFDDLSNKERALFTSLKNRPFPTADRFFVAESGKVVRQLLRSSILVQSVLLTREWLEKLRDDLEREREEELFVYVADKPRIESIVGFQLHEGIMAIAEVPPMPPLEPERERKNESSVRLFLEGINDAENMGAILRNAAAMGVAGVSVSATSCSPYLRRAVRVSMGAVFNLEIRTGVNAREELAAMKAMGFHLVGTAESPDACSLWDYRWDFPVCLVIGSEGSGLPGDVASLCEKQVRIPMKEPMDSLNVGVAVGILLAHVNWQRSLEL
ncbi:MAG: RNA methyltransferase [Chlorobi bacterium]|nr:RNA methyltransferase [Chlorobiota bacterium]